MVAQHGAKSRFGAVGQSPSKVEPRDPQPGFRIGGIALDDPLEDKDGFDRSARTRELLGVAPIAGRRRLERRQRHTEHD